MNVFIEQSGEKHTKNIFDKKTGKLVETVPFDLTYPYPYGYILNTRAEDGQNVDCYVITTNKLQVASIVECEPIGMVEWFEDGVADHKVLMVPNDETGSVTSEVKARITQFALHFFDHQPQKKYSLGLFLGKGDAEELIIKSSK
ncbi:MAG: inorganic diphosphatase [Patescibacteria group bacterium]|jgi:inorganic pyrophosphatase